MTESASRPRYISSACAPGTAGPSSSRSSLSSFSRSSHGSRRLSSTGRSICAYDVSAGKLDPDVAVGWRFDDYRRGVDTVLDRALQEFPESATAEGRAGRPEKS
ncbi:MAG: hypothetical protein M3R31_07905 [Pseudomonadota bacterium]|nr:hypothetical protein [Pseudomonadota bacterium]